MVFLEMTYGTDVEAVVAEIMVKFQVRYNTLKKSWRTRAFIYESNDCLELRSSGYTPGSSHSHSSLHTLVEVRSDPEVSHKLSDAQM